MKSKRKRDHSKLPPLPPDAPLLSIEDAAAYLRTTPAAVRKMLDGRPEGGDQLAQIVRTCMVKLSPRRRYIRREPFLRALGVENNGVSGDQEGIVSFPKSPPSA